MTDKMFGFPITCDDSLNAPVHAVFGPLRIHSILPKVVEVPATAPHGGGEYAEAACSLTFGDSGDAIIEVQWRGAADLLLPVSSDFEKCEEFKLLPWKLEFVSAHPEWPAISLYRHG